MKLRAARSLRHAVLTWLLPCGGPAWQLPLMADARAGAPAAGMDVAEAALPADTGMKARRPHCGACSGSLAPGLRFSLADATSLACAQPSKQMRMAGKVAAPIKRVGAYIRGAGPGPAPAPAPSMDAVEMDTGM